MHLNRSLRACALLLGAAGIGTVRPARAAHVRAEKVPVACVQQMATLGSATGQVRQPEELAAFLSLKRGSGQPASSGSLA